MARSGKPSHKVLSIKIVWQGIKTNIKRARASFKRNSCLCKTSATCFVICEIFEGSPNNAERTKAYIDFSHLPSVFLRFSIRYTMFLAFFIRLATSFVCRCPFLRLVGNSGCRFYFGQPCRFLRSTYWRCLAKNRLSWIGCRRRTWRGRSWSW